MELNAGPALPPPSTIPVNIFLYFYYFHYHMMYYKHGGITTGNTNHNNNNNTALTNLTSANPDIPEFRSDGDFFHWGDFEELKEFVESVKESSDFAMPIHESKWLDELHRSAYETYLMQTFLPWERPSFADDQENDDGDTNDDDEVGTISDMLLINNDNNTSDSNDDDNNDEWSGTSDDHNDHHSSDSDFDKNPSDDWSSSWTSSRQQEQSDWLENLVSLEEFAQAMEEERRKFEENYDELIANITAGFDMDQIDKTNRFLKMYNIIQIVFDVSVKCIFSVVGLGTNIVNMMAFHRQGLLSDSCTPSFVTLAWSDFSICLTSFMTLCLKDIIYHTGAEEKLDAYNTVTGIHIGSLLSTLAGETHSWVDVFASFSCFITLYLCMERMVSVIFPFQMKTIFSPKRCYIHLAVIFVLNLILTLPRIMVVFEWSEDYFDGSKRVSPRFVISTELYELAVLTKDYYIRPAAVILIVLFTVVIIVKVQLSKKFRNASSSSSSSHAVKPSTVRFKDKNKDNGNSGKDKKQNDAAANSKEMKLTKLLIGLSCFYIVCFLPKFFYYFFDYSVVRDSYVRTVLEGFMYLMSVVSASMTFVFYYVMSVNFRKNVQQLCRCCCRCR